MPGRLLLHRSPASRRLASTLLLFALALSPTTGQAAPPDGHGAIAGSGSFERGGLLIRSADGLREAPHVSTEVTIEVTALIARTRVRQRFTNPTGAWVEGVYVFPLPDGSAVDGLAMRIGDRIIEGRVDERAEARRTYEAAKSEGRKASLVEQERPNVFTTSIAHLGPGEAVDVILSYQEDVRYDAGRFTLRFPMVVAPRYVPGDLGHAGLDGERRGDFDPDHVGDLDAEPDPDAEADLDAVPDADRITPPVFASAGPFERPLRLSVAIDTGFPLAELDSPSHAIDVRADAGGHRHLVTLRDGVTPANADFVLDWRPAIGDAPDAALFRERWAGDDYALLLVLPPQDGGDARARLSREMLLVIDVSGSMAGASIEQARRAVLRALDRLQPEDAFDVIAFASGIERLFDESRPATPEALDEARRFVRSLEADGGTNVRPALEAALEPGRASRAVRQIVFVTDGAIGNERALFGLIEARLGRSRLYTVGIGSAPNAHFMRKAAQVGRGTFTYVDRPDAVEDQMRALFEKIERPVLHDLRIDWGVRGVESWPARLPDVYAGEPVVVAARLPAGARRAVLRGRRDGEPLEIPLDVAGGAERPGIARLWARRKVESLMDTLHAGADREDVSRAVAALGVHHQIVTRWSSLVAVDVRPTAPSRAELDTRALPTLLPRDWLPRRIEGPDASPPPANSDDPGAPTIALAEPGPRIVLGRLPRGATPAPLLLLLGAALLGAGALLGHRARSAG